MSHNRNLKYLIQNRIVYRSDPKNDQPTEVYPWGYYFEDGTISFPMNCPDLIPNYFDLASKNYLDEQLLLLKRGSLVQPLLWQSRLGLGWGIRLWPDPNNTARQVPHWVEALLPSRESEAGRCLFQGNEIRKPDCGNTSGPGD